MNDELLFYVTVAVAVLGAWLAFKVIKKLIVVSLVVIALSIIVVVVYYILM